MSVRSSIIKVYWKRTNETHNLGEINFEEINGHFIINNSILRRITGLNVWISYYKCKSESIYSVRVWLDTCLYFKILTFFQMKMIKLYCKINKGILQRITGLNVWVSLYKCKSDSIYNLRVWVNACLYLKILTSF